VFGAGNPDSRVLFLGEAPGEHEVRTGVPFSGPAGKVFDTLLDRAGISKEDFFITNIVRCRPTDVSAYGNTINRSPSLSEITACSPHLDALVKRLSPVFILCIGGPAAKAVISPTLSITRQRGVVVKSTRYGVPSMGVLHPSYIMRQANEDAGPLKVQAVKDLLVAKLYIKEHCT